MEQDKKQCREYVEAVPGPAIIISKLTLKKIKANDSSLQNKERLEAQKKLFKNIIKENELSKEKEEKTV